MSPKRLALLALELQSRLDALESERTEPIAIVGIGCRIPGAESGPAEFWRLLAGGVDAVAPVPGDRWNPMQYYDVNPDAPGRMSTNWGSFLSEVDRFDAPFFGIARREALSMDPQQRILLEVCWEALEHAGHSPRELSGTATGVYVGICTSDYHGMLLNRSEEFIDAYLATGTAHSIAAGRISYCLGFQGPNIAVDTACSASLVAVHLACQSLRLRECRQALAGGVNTILAPEVTIALSKAHMMANDGRCKAFDAAADGFVRGEGCGVVVLKRLTDAEADGDRILALIRGSAINQDGRSSGITAPNGAAQEAVIRLALASAGVMPHEIGYLETHGTGTALGDPIEAHALAKALGTGRTLDNPLTLGSVKTNLGHLEAAAGVVGLIKVVLSLENEAIPAHLHFRKMNPHIDWGGMPVEIPLETRPWRRGAQRRLAGVSSFGFSGTNAHVIVEEAPVSQAPLNRFERPLHILALSARSQPALQKLREQYAEQLGQTSAGLGDICFTANAGRTHFDDRASWLGATREQMQESLKREPEAGGRAQGTPEITFLFSGQGSQYVGMGKELWETQPVFRRGLEECAELLKEELEKPLLEVLWGGASHLLEQTAYTQPCLFALEYALAGLWKSWGIKPAVVLGHSVGEYVAACVAGVYSLADGLKLIAGRGRLMQGVTGEGAMAAVTAAEERVREALQGLEARVSVAALNAPESVVISGYAAELKIAEERLSQAGIRVQRLAVSHGFHSPQMQGMEGAFEEMAGRMRYGAPRVGLISSVTGRRVGREEMSQGSYWRRQVSQPVRFREALETLQGERHTVFLEVGPGTTLVGLGRQCLGGEGRMWMASLKKGRGEWEQILESLGRLYVRGAEVNWAGFDQPYERRRVALPTYPFERQRYWIEGEDRSRRSVPRPAETHQESADPPADWWYTLSWEPKPIHATERSNEGLPVPSALARSLTPRASELRIQQGFDRYAEISPLLDALSSAFVIKGLRRAGWALTAGERVSISELQSRLGIVESHRMLFRRVLEMLEEDQVLRREEDIWCVLRTPPDSDPSANCHSLEVQYPDFGNELALLGRCGASLESVLQGSANPIQLLFPDGSLEALEQVYTNSPGPRVFNQLAMEAVVAEVDARPDGMIRILEIGAGTGGTTTYLAKALPAARAEYTFTDVSPLFTARASEKFQRYPFFSYQTLDIELEPTAQGFQTGAFDIVVAANVLHATQDLRATIRNARKLLAPSGLLVLIEGTVPERWVDLTFGMTEGWWRFRDYALRPSYPLISRESWLTLLREEGFQEPGAVQPAEGSQQAVFLARAPSHPAGANARWLVVPDSRGFATAFAKKLRPLGANIVFLGPTEAAQPHLQSATYDHVVDFSALDIPGVQGLTPETLAACQSIGTANFLARVQALVSSQSAARLWLVTRGAQPVVAGQSDFHITQAPLWGLAKTFALEHPESWGGALDLDPISSPEESAAALLPAILLHDGEDQSAFRNGTRHVARLTRRPAPARSAASFRSDSLYLITGGLGGLGLKIANWMVERGARRLLLLSRSGLPNRSLWAGFPTDDATGKRIAAVRDLEALGADVRISATDVTDSKAMEQLFASLRPGELKGVIHAAATPDSCLIRDLSAGKLASILKPKTEGTWILHQLTESMQLDFFVLFSSWASLLGARELGHYVAANQFLDGFAHYRRAAGLPALSINWAAWDEIRAASEAVLHDYARGGLRFMQSDRALTALGWMIASADPQIAVAAVDWAVLKPLYESRQRRPLLEHMFNAPPTGTNALQPEGIAGLLAHAGPEERMELLLSAIRLEVATVLRIDPGDVDVTKGLFELGMDSLMAVEFKGRLESSVQVPLPSTLTFSYPTVRALAKYLDQRMQQNQPGRDNSASTSGADSDDASEDQLAARLAASLKELEQP